MSMDKESLFSLELVVEKLYVPHVQCRFPAIAFRLLDFPTILIEHVEEELATKIKHQIKKDPYYRLPDQFLELKDKHGNFMIKKGKSCLFKMTTQSLNNHLSNTPLYVMVLDTYQEVSKLIGNCTVPLDDVMRHVVEDVESLGNSVPSVHGDKGLFKIFSLMGKEIGYVVMGFRLLSLGPGLIAHIPESAIAKPVKSQSKGQVQVTEEAIMAEDHMKAQSAQQRNNYQQRKQQEENLLSTHDMGSMTEPEMHDMLVQTIDMADKQVHVALHEPVVSVQTQANNMMEGHDMQTQTERKKKNENKWVSDLEFRTESPDIDDDIIQTDVNLPPPLFYNSKNERKTKIQTQRVYALGDDADDQSSVYTDECSDSEKPEKEVSVEKKTPAKYPYKQENFQQNLHLLKKRNEEFKKHHIPDFKESNQEKDAMKRLNVQNLTNQASFPILTALLNEIMKIKNPQVIEQSVQQIEMITKVDVKKKQAPTQPRSVLINKKFQENMTVNNHRFEEMNDKLSNEKEDSYFGEKARGRKSHRKCAHSQDEIPKQKSWIRKAPEVAVKKSKLTYGLTNTQRLRLAKVNPQWVNTMDKEEADYKQQKQNPTKVTDDEEFDTGNMSDTLTEVRRLAQKNLEATALDDTLPNDSLKQQSIKKNRRRLSPPRKTKSPKQPSRKRSKSPKSQNVLVEKMAVSDEKSSKAKQLNEDHKGSDNSDPPSARSIQVRIPSAQVYDDDDSDEDLEIHSSREKTESTKRANNFAGFIDDDDASVNLEPIDKVDGGVDDSFLYDPPLESTRNSKPAYSPQKNKQHEESADGSFQYNNDSFESGSSPRVDRRGKANQDMFRSTEDYDTQQFLSTEEPELQKLMSGSGGNKSNVSNISDVLSSGRSAKSPVPVSASVTSAKFKVINPKASLNSPIPALRRSHQKLDLSKTKLSPTGSPRTSYAHASPSGTPRSVGSSKFPTPRPRKVLKRLDLKHESIHTESVSSYLPSDMDNTNPSGGSASYSDDFSGLSGKDEGTKKTSFPRMIPSTKLGYTT